MNAALAAEMRHQTLILVAGLALLFGLIIVVFRFLVTRRLAAISGHFQDIASHTESPWMTPVAGHRERRNQRPWFRLQQTARTIARLSCLARKARRRAYRRVGTDQSELRKEAVIRRQAEDDLRKYSEEISDLYNNAPCGYHSLGPDGTFLQMNARSSDGWATPGRKSSAR